MRDAVAEFSLLRRGPPVPPVRPLLVAAHSSRLRAAPHARAGSVGTRAAFGAAVPPQQRDPRRICVLGLLNLVEHGPDALPRNGAAALRLAEAVHGWVCDPPV